MASWFLLLNFSSTSVNTDVTKMFPHAPHSQICEIKTIVAAKRLNIAAWARKFFNNALAEADPEFVRVMLRDAAPPTLPARVERVFGPVSVSS
jgi:hypothetical protein